MKKYSLLNAYVNNVSMNEAIREIENKIICKEKAYVVSVNVDVIVKMEEDEELRQIANEADLTLVDGKPLIWLSRWNKHAIKQKISGSDLVPKLCGVAAQKGYSVFILGGRDGVADKAADNLKRQYPSIKIVGTYAPHFGFEKDAAELEKMNGIISVAKPDILIVCLGCPKQEKWIKRNYRKYDAIVSVCAGATVDFLAGNVKRAPRWMSDYGLEWLYRFLQEPQRLFKRYFVDDIKVLKLIWKYR